MKKDLAMAFGIGFGAAAVIIAAMLFGFSMLIGGAYENNALSKEEIFDVVNENYDTIISDIQKSDFSESERIEGIRKVEAHSGGVIEFYSGEEGLSASGAEYGFYYTEDDSPKVSFLSYVLFTEEDLKPSGQGFCFDEYDYYYTEKIRDNFYYYESHY